MKILAKNRKAYFNYEILEKIEAGISLIGQEVKSIKNGQINLSGSVAVISNNMEAFLLNANIPPFQPANAKNYEPERPRKLILKKMEIKKLFGKTKEKGLTLVPLMVYTKNALIKVEIGLGRIKKKFDKRETIKKRDFEREKRSLKYESI
ncbi:MAG: SsrA-binding protein SmpB [bacterium]|nr:SsrA-binding protein SmpB [bacterium]